MEKHNKIKEYWETRALEYTTSPQATTNDVYMREIEINTLAKTLADLNARKPLRRVADIGCGNGYSTLRLASALPSIDFSGYDYSAAMLDSANQAKAEAGIANASFQLLDITNDALQGGFDAIITDRCLINLVSWEAQQEAIAKIHGALAAGGVYLMIENFEDGQNRMNELRRAFGLQEIGVRDHNLFFADRALEDYVGGLFGIERKENISSAYYIVSRVIYSAICKANGTAPDYLDIHHSLASMLPSVGDYGPISLYVLRKK